MTDSEFSEIYRTYYGTLFSSLVSFFGMKLVEEAEDIVQDTFTSAYQSWQKGLPKDPKAWLFKVCKNKALNHIQKKSTQDRNLKSMYEPESYQEYQLGLAFSPNELKNQKLRVMFTLCHPVLSEKMQLILMLKVILGFSRDQISKGLGITKESVKKILYRGKQKLKEAGISLKTPYLFQLSSRLQSVQKSLYILFNEGYHASEGGEIISKDFCLEALFLLKMLIEEGIHNPSTQALLALMYFNLARFESRIGPDGSIIDLENQDRQLWDRKIISVGMKYLRSSREGNMLSRYHLEAAIASLHCTAPTFEATNWRLIVSYYEKLYSMAASPFIQLNRCIALSYAENPGNALKEIERYDLATKLKDYFLFHVTEGKLLVRLGRKEEALESFQQGHALANLAAEKIYIQQCIDSLSDS